MTFQKATKSQAKLRLALDGPAGYGKTITALKVATFLAARVGKRVALLDTEAGSASKYAHLFDFDVLEVEPPYHPDKVVKAIKDAEDGDYGAIVLDSLSHFWAGEGGLLAIVDALSRSKYKNDSHRAWAEATPMQQAMTDAILRSRLHLIATMRTKKDYVRSTDDKGKTQIRAAGTKTVQRDEFDYEFDVMGRFDSATNLAITKSRIDTMPPETFFALPGDDFALILATWLEDGTSTEPTDEQKARLAVALAAGSKVDTDRFSAAKAEELSGALHGRPLEQLTTAEFEKVVSKIEAAAQAAVAPPAAEQEVVA